MKNTTKNEKQCWKNLISLILCFSREQCQVKQFAMFLLDKSFYHGPLNPAATCILTHHCLGCA